MKEAKLVKPSEMEHLNIKRFGINLRGKDVDKFIDELEGLCEKYALNDRYQFKFD